jgi:hypothetical protein
MGNGIKNVGVKIGNGVKKMGLKMGGGFKKFGQKLKNARHIIVGVLGKVVQYGMKALAKVIAIPGLSQALSMAGNVVGTTIQYSTKGAAAIRNGLKKSFMGPAAFL